MPRHGQAALVAAALAGALIVPARADAQWYVASYSGGSVTRPATVTLDQPADGRHLEFRDVSFETRAFESPQYYGARIGRLFASGRLGVEVEFLHTKTLARTGRLVHVVGSDGGDPLDATMTMDTFVQRHNMTHGLNFWLVNLVWRTPLGAGAAPRVALTARAGAGAVVAGVDSVVGQVSTQGYQLAGPGAHAAAGLDVRLRARLSAFVEYKLTRAHPVIDVDRGTAGMTALTHHVAAGIAFGFAR
jgi:hypothetical protein